MQQIRSGVIGFCWLYPPNAVSQRSSHPELLSTTVYLGENTTRGYGLQPQLQATDRVTGLGS